VGAPSPLQYDIAGHYGEGSQIVPTPKCGTNRNKFGAALGAQCTDIDIPASSAGVAHASLPLRPAALPQATVFGRVNDARSAYTAPAQSVRYLVGHTYLLAWHN